eukprot:Nk52_evm45s217 gene=Nk52_evmTU45s217
MHYELPEQYVAENVKHLCEELGGDRIGLANFVGWELANNSMENYYTTQLEIGIMKLLSGFPKEGICFLLRNWYPPEAEELAKQIFPFAWEEIAKYDLSTEEQKKINFVPRQGKLGLLRLYTMCARVLVQDIPFLMTEKNSDSKIWDFPLLHTEQFKEWSRMQVEHVQRLTVERPELTSIRQFAPNVESLYYQTNRAVGDIRDDVASLKDSVDARMDELENSLKIDMAALKASMKVVQLSNDNEIHARRSAEEGNKRKLLEAMATALGISVKFEETNPSNDEFEEESENESESEGVTGRKGDEESEREIERAGEWKSVEQSGGEKESEEAAGENMAATLGEEEESHLTKDTHLFPRRPPKKRSNYKESQQRNTAWPQWKTTHASPALEMVRTKRHKFRTSQEFVFSIEGRVRMSSRSIKPQNKKYQDSPTSLGILQLWERDCFRVLGMCGAVDVAGPVNRNGN